MKKIVLDLIFICIITVLLSSFFFADASDIEESQFSLFLSERNINIKENNYENIPQHLNNVNINDIPQSLRAAFNRLGNASSQLLVDDRGEPMLTADDVQNYTFTGPYYFFSKAYITEGLSINDFRKSFTYEPMLAYIIRFENRPVGILNVMYENGKYEYVYTSSNIYAEDMIREIELLSTSKSKPEDDIIFLGIGPVRYAFNSKDTIIATLDWTPEPVTFEDLVKAYYVSEMEMKILIEKNGGNNDIVGGSGAADYLYNFNEYIGNYGIDEQEKENTSALPFIMVCLTTTITIFILLMYFKNRKHLDIT